MPPSLVWIAERVVGLPPRDTAESPGLRAAQARLLARRLQRRAERRDQGLPICTRVDGRPLVTAPCRRQTTGAWPAHLGWHSAAVTRMLRPRQVQPARRPAHPASPSPLVNSRTAVPGQAAAPATLTVFPDVALAMLRTSRAAAGRIWLLLRHLDSAGRGWLDLAAVRPALTSRYSPLRVCGWRQLRHLLQQGEGLFWQRSRGRIWLRSVARVAAALDVWRLRGRPVAVNVAPLLAGMGQVRAHLYASFHSGRGRKPAAPPIARATLQALTGVHPRTQRRYDRRTRVRRHANFALGRRIDDRQAQEQAWQQGRAAFHFRDGAGGQGRPGATYLAWQLPNQYEGPHQPKPGGRLKRINRRLADLSLQGMTGNGRRRQRRIQGTRFFRHGKAAAQAQARGARDPLYWPTRQPRRARLWYCLHSPSVAAETAPIPHRGRERTP